MYLYIQTSKDAMTNENISLLESAEDIKLLEGPEEDKETPEDFLRENIRKANVFLDAALEQINAEHFDGTHIGLGPEMLTAAARMVDSISNASDKLLGAANDFESLLLKQETLKLKEKELQLKMISGQTPKSLSQTNIVVTSREELMKLIKNKGEDKNDDGRF